MYTQAEFKNTITLLENTLCNAAKQRNKRSEFLTNQSGETNIGWVFFERAEMLKIVNNIRIGKGFDPVTTTDVKRVEDCAVGYIDYSRKFAIGCAKLALEN